MLSLLYRHENPVGLDEIKCHWMRSALPQQIGVGVRAATVSTQRTTLGKAARAA